MRILLAGAESEGHFEDLLHVAQYSEAPLNILMSYLYFRKKSPEKTVSILRRMREAGAWCMLDSGAHTYLKNWRETREKIKARPPGFLHPEEYLKQYIEWLVEFGEYFQAYVELDINLVMNVPTIEKWREWFWDAGLSPIPVFHSTMEPHYVRELKLPGHEAKPYPQGSRMKARMHVWEQWCKDDRMPYLGLPGKLKQKEYAELLQVSDKYAKPVHGFAMTKIHVFHNLSFYTVDSTSWKAGQEYGSTYFVQGSKLKVVNKDNKAQRRSPGAKEQCEKYHIGFEELCEDDPVQVMRFNAASWMEYQKVIDWQHRNDVVVQARGEAPVMEGAMVKVPENRDLLEEATIGRWCRNCYIANKCPFYEEEAACSVPFSRNPMGRDPTMSEMLRSLTTQAFDRIQFALATERVKGGLLDPEVSKELRNFVGLCQKIKVMTQERPPEEVTITAKGGTGIVAQIFGGFGKQGSNNPSERERLDEASVIDVPVSEEK